MNFVSSDFFLFKIRKIIPEEGMINNTSNSPGKPINIAQYKCADSQQTVSISQKSKILLSISLQLKRFNKLFENEVY